MDRCQFIVHFGQRKRGKLPGDLLHHEAVAFVLHFTDIELVQHALAELFRHQVDGAAALGDKITGWFLGLAQVIALKEVGSQLHGFHGLLFRFHTLGQHQGPDVLAKPHEGLEDLTAVVVFLKVHDQVPVDLEDVGLDQGDAVQVGMSLSHVVQGDQKAVVAVDPDKASQRLYILHLGFEYLDDNGGRIDVQLPAHVQEVESADFEKIDDRGLEIHA